jgi:flagellar protein FliS
MNYRQQALAVMNSVEMIVALYDGMIRFLHGAIDRVEAGDVAGRRQSVGRALDILTYLQARLRPGVGGSPAGTLSEFYAAMYAQCVRASRDASIPLLEQTIRDIRNVREAWQQVAASETATTEQARDQQRHQQMLQFQQASSARTPPPEGLPAQTSNRWSA